MPPPRSVAAVAAFVCSLLGCLGITAVAGLILGIVGIVQTAGGKRRGLGLAIAAIPISCVTSVIFLVLLASTLATWGLFHAQGLAGKVLKADAATAAKLIAEKASPELRAAANESRTGAWLSAVRARHGTFVGMGAADFAPPVTENPKVQVFPFTGKFVNGTAPVTISVSISLKDIYKLEDLAVDGVSLRSGDLKESDSKGDSQESDEVQPSSADSPGSPPS